MDESDAPSLCLRFGALAVLGDADAGGLDVRY
jgi:hypothetical protein